MDLESMTDEELLTKKEELEAKKAELAELAEALDAEAKRRLYKRVNEIAEQIEGLEFWELEVLRQRIDAQKEILEPGSTSVFGL